MWGGGGGGGGEGVKPLQGHLASHRQDQDLPYRIYPAIKRGFCPSRMTSNNYISPMKSCYNTNFTHS